MVDALKNKPHLALVTVCTPSFLPGTLVMLRSFLDNNPWFAGDVIILTNRIEEKMQRLLSLLYPVRFRLVGQRLVENAASVRAAVIDRSIVEARFYALEAFAVSGYDKLLYLDSDVLITADLKKLVERPEAFVAVGDGFHYRDKLRSGPDYRPHTLRFWQKRRNYWSGQFNAGVMLVASSLLAPQVYADLVGMIAPENFQQGVARFHDQKLLNVYFYQRATLVSATYNYRFGIARQILEKDGVRMEDAAILHFTARKKPWQEDAGLTNKKLTADYSSASKAWWDCWHKFSPAIRAEALNRGDRE